MTFSDLFFPFLIFSDYVDPTVWDRTFPNFYTEGDGVGVALKFSSCVRILLFLHDRSFAHTDGKSPENVSFSVGVRKCMTRHTQPCFQHIFSL